MMMIVFMCQIMTLWGNVLQEVRFLEKFDPSLLTFNFLFHFVFNSYLCDSNQQSSIYRIMLKYRPHMYVSTLNVYILYDCITNLGLHHIKFSLFNFLFTTPYHSYLSHCCTFVYIRFWIGTVFSQLMKFMFISEVIKLLCVL